MNHKFDTPESGTPNGGDDMPIITKITLGLPPRSRRFPILLDDERIWLAMREYRLAVRLLYAGRDMPIQPPRNRREARSRQVSACLLRGKFSEALGSGIGHELIVHCDRSSYAVALPANVRTVVDPGVFTWGPHFLDAETFKWIEGLYRDNNDDEESGGGKGDWGGCDDES